MMYSATSLVAQADPSSPFGQLIPENLGESVLSLVVAIGYLLVGLVVALLVAGAVRGLLKRTDLDNRVAGWLAGQEGGETIPVEKWVGGVVFWLIFLFAVVASLDTLELEQVSTPLNALLEQITAFLPRLFMAGVLLAGAWLLATAVKMATTRILQTFNIDRQVNEQAGSSDFSLSETVGNSLFWFILLLLLPSILSTLQLEGTLLPVQGLVDEILGFVPKLFAAILVGAIGWFVAQIIRRFVSSFLASVGVDRFGDRVGLGATDERQSLSGILGTVVFVLVLIPTVIAALQRLAITAVSEPATLILEQVFAAIPRVFLTLVILVVFYLVAQIVSDLLSGFLAQVGFNDILRQIGISTDATPPATVAVPSDVAGGTPGGTTARRIEPQTPSEIAGTVAQVGIMLVGTFIAVDRLEIEALSLFVGELVDIAGRVLVGVLVFAAGLWLANLAFRLIRNSGIARSGIVGQAARVGIIAFVLALALNVIGIATSIVNLAFGLLLGAIAVALAIAFGWGGRDIAAELLREWLNGLRSQ